MTRLQWRALAVVCLAVVVGLLIINEKYRYVSWLAAVGAAPAWYVLRRERQERRERGKLE